MGAPMITATESPAAPEFVQQIGSKRPVKSELFRVSFHRGGVIECASETEVLAAIDAHLARAKKNHVFDKVLHAEHIIKPGL